MVDFRVRMPVKVQKKKKWVLASCPVLDIHSQGETEEKAKKNLAEAISLFLISCFERGTLDAVLKNCGFKPRYEMPSAKLPPMKSQNFIDVPIPFYINEPGKSECLV
jgi:predicted RNase H-like HicB family nuclease